MKKLVDSSVLSLRARRLLIVFGVVVASASLAPTTAWATGNGDGNSSSTTVSSAIKAGNDAHTVGYAKATRTRTANSQRLKVVLTVDGGIKESHLCVSAKPYTSRVSPGKCPYSTGSAPSTVTYDVDLGSATGTEYVQAHTVTAQGETAYAGWQSGSPFYGNLAIADPGGDGTPVPIGAVGALLLSGLVAGGVMVRRGPRR